MLLFAPVAEQYADFAAYTAADSACLNAWARGVVGDPEVQEWIARLPPIKQQPNLVFAAARWHGVPAPGPYEGLREALLRDDGLIAATIMARSTQTNEVGRLAALAPVFARVAQAYDGPLALVELGPSAGLCLFPDRYTHVYEPRDEPCGDVVRWSPGRRGPELLCRVRGPMPITGAQAATTGLDIAWRGGLDVRPLDVTDGDAMAWLAYLVWPEQHHRLVRLRAAVAIARTEPPRLTTGNLLTDLDPLIEEAAAFGRPVVYHSAVLAYLSEGDRGAFTAAMAERVRAGRCSWVAYEGENILPEVTRRAPVAKPRHPKFALALDGVPVAWAHGHGRSMTWFGDDPEEPRQVQ